MSDTEQLQERGRRLRGLLDQEMPMLQGVEIDGSPSTVWHVSNLLAHVLQDSLPVYFSGRILDMESGQLEFAFLTDKLAVHGKGRPVGTELELRIVPRSGLERFDVLSAPAEIIAGNSSFGRERPSGKYRLTYQGGVSFTLPVDQGRWSGSQEELEQMVPKLIQDLATR